MNTVPIILSQIDKANEVAKEAFAAGDKVTGAAALVLAAQLLQLARIWEKAK